MTDEIFSWQPDLFSAPRWICNRHMQTIIPFFFGPRPKVLYRRERIETPDGDFLDLDWVDGQSDLPLVIACHGLEGSSNSHYILNLMDRLRHMGWNGLALNFRGCSGEDNRKLRCYHFGEIGDLDLAISRGREKFTKLYLAGYSLGGNVVGRWLEERGNSCLVSGACLCNVPFELEACQQSLDRGFNLLYTWNFLHSLKPKSRRRHDRFPGAFDIARAMRARTFREFDDAVTAPIHGFSDYLDYYHKCGIKPRFGQIRIPTLLLHALDDPFIPRSCCPTEDELNRHVIARYTEHGGHVGFMDRKLGFRWLDIQVANWLKFLHTLPKKKDK